MRLVGEKDLGRMRKRLRKTRYKRIRAELDCCPGRGVQTAIFVLYFLVIYLEKYVGKVFTL